MKPYYETELGRLYCGDCLEVIPELEQVDLVLTDPPYNENFQYRGSNFVDYREDYFDFLKTVLSSANNILKNTGSIYFKHSSRQINKIFPILESYFKFRNLIIWISNSQAHPKLNYDSYYEPVYFYTKTDDYVFNKKAELRDRPKDYWSGEGKEFIGLITNCWYDIKKIQAGCLKAEGGTENNLKLHPCSMPVALATRAMNIPSNPQDVVLDMFLGSGTTAIAAERLGRRWIGIEQGEEYCEIAKQRIKQELSQKKLPGF